MNADLLTVTGGRIRFIECRCLDSYCAWCIQAVPFDTFKTFDIVWHGDPLHKPNSYGIFSQIFSIFFFFFSVVACLNQGII